MALAKNIRACMQDKGLNRTEVSERIGISKEVFSVKMSRDNMNIKSLAQIAEALDCDIVLRDRTTGKIY